MLQALGLRQSARLVPAGTACPPWRQCQPPHAPVTTSTVASGSSQRRETLLQGIQDVFLFTLETQSELRGVHSFFFLSPALPCAIKLWNALFYQAGSPCQTSGASHQVTQRSKVTPICTKCSWMLLSISWNHLLFDYFYSLRSILTCSFSPSLRRLAPTRHLRSPKKPMPSKRCLVVQQSPSWSSWGTRSLLFKKYL